MEHERSQQDGIKLAEYFAQEGLLDVGTAIEALQEAEKRKTSYVLYLAKSKFINAYKLAFCTAKYYQLPLYDISVHKDELISLDYLDFDSVKRQYGIPIFQKGDTLHIAAVEPSVIDFNRIQFLTGLNTECIIVQCDKLQEYIEERLLPHREKSEKQAASSSLYLATTELDKVLSDVSITPTKEEVISITEEDINDTPVVRFVNKILLDAILSKASDIHFEPYENFCRVRCRRDGILYPIVNTPKKLSQSIAARIKVVANLDVSERRIPQDGRFRLNIPNRESVDIRVNTCPMIYGEKIVMRLLMSGESGLSADELGMDETQRKDFLNATENSQGMILVTGPTGSGKTVTLYSALKILNSTERNISTVEDPVEIFLEGINQTQVNIKTGMSFAKALRAFLRQDPDIIMVGEIRDLETAEIAVKAAQTGHLVLSTLHTNSATLTLSRLSSMGLEPFNIASTVSLVMAQRLVRKLCPACKKPDPNPDETLLKSGISRAEVGDDVELYIPVGCSQCSQGYRGRIGIFEVIPISDAMTHLIMKKCDAIDFQEQADKEGLTRLREAGIEKIKQGITTVIELTRVLVS